VPGDRSNGPVTDGWRRRELVTSSPVPTSVLDQPLHFDADENGARALRARRITTTLFTGVVSLIVVVALLEVFVDVPGYGIDTATTSASSGGTTVTVRFARATRGQLVTPLDVNVERTGGFQGPITLTMSSDYLDLFISNDLSPSPSSETSTATALVMTFDPPASGDVLDVRWDVVAKPSGWFAFRVGHVAVLGDDGTPVLTVSFRTSVRP
jgi:hypothetical protein